MATAKSIFKMALNIKLTNISQNPRPYKEGIQYFASHYLTLRSYTPESDCGKTCLVLYPFLTQYSFIAKPCDLFSKSIVLDPI